MTDRDYQNACQRWLKAAESFNRAGLYLLRLAELDCMLEFKTHLPLRATVRERLEKVRSRLMNEPHSGSRRLCLMAENVRKFIL